MSGKTAPMNLLRFRGAGVGGLGKRKDKTTHFRPSFCGSCIGRWPWQQSAFLDVCTLGTGSRSPRHSKKKCPVNAAKKGNGRILSGSVTFGSEVLT